MVIWGAGLERDYHPREVAKRVKAPAQPRIFYGWVIVLISFLTMLLVMGTRLSFGVFYSSMLAEMGWSRAATAGIFSLSMLVYAVVASGVGAAFDWWGPRRMFPVAAMFLGVGFFLCSRMTTLWEFYLYYGVIVGTGFTALGFIPHVALMARWFDRQRGLATSLALAGTGRGASAGTRGSTGPSSPLGRWRPSPIPGGAAAISASRSRRRTAGSARSSPAGRAPASSAPCPPRTDWRSCPVTPRWPPARRCPSCCCGNPEAQPFRR